MKNDDLPTYDELPVKEGLPPGSTWGLWGDDDQLGTLNLLNDARTLAAVETVRRGAVFPLNLPLEEPDPQLVWRAKPEHHILHVGHELRGMEPGGQDDPSTGMMDRDDYIDGLWLQGSTQWDGLTHIRHPLYGNYNGVPDSDIHGGPGTRLGVDQWAERAIVGRGVLVDMKRHYEATGQRYDVMTAHQITPADIEAALDRQGVELLGGDIVLVHTGWMQHFLNADADTRAAMLAYDTQAAPGLQVDDATVEFLWNRRIAAVASDTVGVEAARSDLGFALHPKLLCLLGIPLGEYWALDALASDCEDDGRYEFLLVSVPLNIRGGVGTPPQAVAIK